MSANTNITKEMFYDQVKTYISEPESLESIEKAYDFAFEMHKPQKRKSGEPYFIHCLNVGYTLACIRCGPLTIEAGLLHDVVEDTPASYEQIAEMFGQEVADMVEGVTKIGNISFSDEKEYQAANHRKILIAMAKDIRVILIKLADRLHNMRTLAFQPPEKQKKIASETLQVYAPIAHRLGLAEIKNELEDLSFLYLNPDEYHHIARLVEVKKSEREDLIKKMISDISDILNEHNFQFRIFGRSKHLYSIYNKMTTKHKRFDEIMDLNAIRIVTATELNCYEILGYIHSAYKPVNGRLKDYIAMPKFNMYQSLHTTILDSEGNIFEVQIRTEEMDRVAEMGVAAHWSYKEGKKYNSVAEQKEIENKLSWYHDLITMMDESLLEHPTELMNQVQKDIFEANVYVMSPKGKVIELPNGSTPLDFAYRIHTDVGHSAVGATVNGALVPLNTVLKTGDIVSIKTSKQSTGPSEDWLKIVKTATARNKIRSYLSKKEEEERQVVVAKGEKIYQDELKKRNLDEKVYLDKDRLQNIYGQMGVNSYNELMYALGIKSASAQAIIEKMSTTRGPNAGIDNEAVAKMFNEREKKKPRKISSDCGVIVEGIPGMQVSLAGCCTPVYGEDICGFITKGHGVKIHRKDCVNIQKEQSRLIDAQWDENAGDQQCECMIRLDATDRNYLISDIVNLLSQYKASLSGITSETLPDKVNVFIALRIRVKNADHLHQVMAILKVIDSINDVSRITF